MTLKASADRSFFEQDGRVSVGRLGAHKKTWLIGVERSESTSQEPIYFDGVLDLFFFPSQQFKDGVKSKVAGKPKDQSKAPR